MTWPRSGISYRISIGYTAIIIWEMSILWSAVRLCGEGKTMKYMLLVYSDELAMSEAERERCYAESAKLAQQLNSNRQYLHAAPLHPTSTATCIQVREGKRLITDGPFAETREQLGGYFLIDASNLDEAIAIAARVPLAQLG